MMRSGKSCERYAPRNDASMPSKVTKARSDEKGIKEHDAKAMLSPRRETSDIFPFCLCIASDEIWKLRSKTGAQKIICSRSMFLCGRVDSKDVHYRSILYLGITISFSPIRIPLRKSNKNGGLVSGLQTLNLSN